MIFKKLFNKYKLYAGIILIISAFGVGWEWRDRQADLQVAKMENAYQEMAIMVSEEATERRLELSNTLTRVEQQNSVIEALRQQKQKVVTKRVIEYVKEYPDGRCNLSNDWVQLHNETANPNLSSDGDTTSSSNVNGGATNTINN